MITFTEEQSKIIKQVADEMGITIEQLLQNIVDSVVKSLVDAAKKI